MKPNYVSVFNSFEDFNVVISEHHVFEHAHFEMKQKENVLITGPNGSGKSLLIAMIRQKIFANQGHLKITPSLKLDISIRRTKFE